MKDRERHEEMIEIVAQDWYGRIEDIVREFKMDGYEADFEVVEVNREYITVATEEDDEDVEYQLVLGGTERTITIEKVRRFA